jgi:hypothetical protein
MENIRQSMDVKEIAGATGSALIFTIAARNYLGQVSVLFDSVNKQCGDAKFCCFVVDGYDDDSEIPDKLRNNVFDCRKLAIPDFEELACKYTVVEFSTALKPFIFQYIFEDQKFDGAIYIDPDIKLYSDTNWIEEELRSRSILVTPHLLDYQAYKASHKGRDPVLDLSSFLYAGTYNLGFVAIKNDAHGRDFIDIWGELLRDQCFDDITRSLCVDQKWADFLSSFFGERVGVIKDAGANVAYWNMHERNLTGDVKSNYYVNGSRLKFVHYSSIDLIDKNGISGNARYKNISLVTYPEYRELFTTYKDELIEAGFKERMASMPYRYNYFDNGLPLNKSHRWIFAKLIEEEDVPNPFSATGRFYGMLKEKNLLATKQAKGSDKTQFVSVSRNALKFALWFLYKLLGPMKYLLFMKKLRIVADRETKLIERT